MTKKFNSTVHRDLIKRLLIAALATSIVIVVIAYFIERNRVINDITFFASQRILQVNPHIYDLLDDPTEIDVDQLMSRIKGKDGPIHQRTGYFPIAVIYDLQGHKLAESLDPEYPDGQALYDVLAAETILEQSTDELVATPTRIAGHPVVRVGLPLNNRHGTPMLHIVGIYALSDVAMAEFNQRLQRTLLFVMLIVATSAIVLYPVVLGLLRRVEGLSVRLLDANLEIIKTLGGAIAKRDSDTDAHNYRVTLYSVRLAESIGASEQTMQGLVKGAFLHDVGKIGTEDRILLKPGKLNDEEFAIMRQHVTHGIDIVNRSAWLADAVPIVGCHHEKYDGSGYPNTLQGEGIPVGARIFALADVFDALTSVRPYKKAFSLEQALEILLEGRGTHFDPDLLDKFIVLVPDLYNRFAGDESDRVHNEVAAIVNTYFTKVEGSS
jgi:HD-GYP domain-containing protein (c-di-GMP phosphodiesterase class II)